VDVSFLVAALDRAAAADEFSGVVRVDQGDRTLLAEGYGLASRTWQVPCRLETRFDTASITKLFTAVAALQQLAAGAFELDTSVTEYLGLSGTSISSAVTPYHLLTHTSGIGDDADEAAGEDYAALFVDRPNYAIRVTEDFLPQFVHKSPNFAPGTGCRYCNCSYVLLGLMVERASGTAYRDYVTDRVFGPAGMDHSGFFAMDLVEPDVAEGADAVTAKDGTAVTWRRNIYSYPPIGSPDGGAHVTAGDLISFHRALGEGRLLNSELTGQMLTPHEDYRQTLKGSHRTGFGFEFLVRPNGEVQSYWKEGMNAGASGILKHYPAADVTVVVLSNREDGAWEPIAAVDRLVTD
jgi:CubicO group peptidase (beta-lactamase class C family)